MRAVGEDKSDIENLIPLLSTTFSFFSHGKDIRRWVSHLPMSTRARRFGFSEVIVATQYVFFNRHNKDT